MGVELVLSGLMILAGASGLPTETHCATGEQVYFSCRTNQSEKVVSLCGQSDSRGAPVWLQYRFGVIGQPEMSFPASRTDSVGKFGGLHQAAKALGLTIQEVWFRVGYFSYLIEHTSGGDCEGECQDVNDLKVLRGTGDLVATLSCVSQVTNSLHGLYGHISDDQSNRP